MEPAEYDYMFHLEDAYWWYVGMRRIARTLLRKQLVDGPVNLEPEAKQSLRSAWARWSHRPREADSVLAGLVR